VPAAAAAALLMATVVPAPTATADECPDVAVIFARGTGEPMGVGKVGEAFVEALIPRLNGRTIETFAVNYPASFDFLEAAAGAEAAAAQVVAVASRCQEAKVVLGGYSQGAAVIDMLARVHPLGGAIGDLGSAPPLSAPFADAITAVAVFGNPAVKFGTPLSQNGEFAGRAIDLCNADDPICSPDGDKMDAHSDYVFAPYPDDSSGFVAERLG
jgi:cutinase